MLISDVQMVSYYVVLILAGITVTRIILQFRQDKPQHSGGPFPLSVNQQAELLEAVPALMWSESNGHIVWANGAMVQMTGKSVGQLSGVREFDLGSTECLPTPPFRGKLHSVQEGSDQWYDITSVNLGDLTYYTAQEANTIILAEDRRANQDRSVWETFSHLPIGLAIFDKNQTLTVYNPALVELLMLEETELAFRPSLEQFVEILHNFGDDPDRWADAPWREQLKALQAVRENGGYKRDWKMPSGSVYRISGHPHLDDALVLLIEDITAALIIQQENKSKLCHFRLALDNASEGLAILEPDGSMALFNLKFQEFLGLSSKPKSDLNFWRLLEMNHIQLADLSKIRARIANYSDSLPTTVTLYPPAKPAIELEISALADGNRFCRVRENSSTLSPPRQLAQTG